MEVSCAFPTALHTPGDIALAEELGYDRAWIYDTPQQSPDVWMTLALAAERTERIGLGPGVAQGGRHLKPAKHADRFAIGGGNQIAANQDREQQQIEQGMACRSGDAGKCRIGRQGAWRLRNHAPGQAKDHCHHQQDADAFMELRGVVIPAIVIAEGHHP